MTLLFDIGNSALHVALARDQDIVWHRTVVAGARHFRLKHIAGLKRGERITGAAISSVVPRLTPVFATLVREQLGLKPLVLSHRTRTGLKLDYDPKSGLGADRIANAAAAFHLYRRDTIVVDLGTATTLETVTRDGRFIGGAILPGLGLMGTMLSVGTARLPEVEPAAPGRFLATSTAGSIRSGIFAAHFAGIDYLIRRISKETRRQYCCIATGGLSSRFGRYITDIALINPLLTLQGLNIIFAGHKNRS
jgi:type III pantothenate kinase